MVIWSISILIGISVIRVTLFTHILFISLILKSPTSFWVHVLSFFLRLWVTEKNGKVKGMSIKMNHKGKIMNWLTTKHHLLRFFVKKKSLHVNTDCSTCYFFSEFSTCKFIFWAGVRPNASRFRRSYPEMPSMQYGNSSEKMSGILFTCCQGNHSVLLLEPQKFRSTWIYVIWS